ncbi:hypothetical protein BDR03DRAFT_952254 [Suillus americanus]|nr:hypothetical protein BDR03DRAFT_952254 [Suillus americanus]
MVKLYGYLVADEWLYQRGVELGHPRPKTVGAPPEERYKPLKEALQKEGPPRWFRAS